MSVSTVVAAFQDLHATISGVATAPDELPGSITEEKCPLAFTFVGGAEWQSRAVGLPAQDREFIIRCFVAPVLEGAGLDESYAKALPLIEAFGLAYLADKTLSGACEQMRAINDEGVGILFYGGHAYHGFVYRVTVREKPAGA